MFGLLWFEHLSGREKRMNGFQEAIHNPVLIAPIVSWLLAQALKFIINLIVTKELKLERLVGGGGMPSSHSATVGALATVTALTYGPASFEFAISAIFAMIVMYDAMNVRLETGRQGTFLNLLVKNEDIKEKLDEVERQQWPETIFKEYVGHTPAQVAVGLVMGILIGWAAFRLL